MLSDILVVAAAPTPGLVFTPTNTIPGLTIYPEPGFSIKTPCTFSPINVPSQLTISSRKVEIPVARVPPVGADEIATAGG